MTAMFVDGSERNEQSLLSTSHRCSIPNINPFGQAVSEEKIFNVSANQKQESSIVAMFVDGSGRNEQACGQVS